MDIGIDAQATLTMLEGRENRERLQVFAEKMAPVSYDDFSLLKARLGNILSKEDIEKIALALTDPSNEDEYEKSPINNSRDSNFTMKLRLRGSSLGEESHGHDSMVLDGIFAGDQ